MSSRPVGIKSESPSTPIAQIPNFRDPLRTVAIDDVAVGSIPTSELIDGTQCRSGAGNQLVLLVNGTTAGVVVKIYVKSGAVWYFFDSQTTSEIDECLTFTGVPALLVAVHCSTVGAGGCVIGGGITK